MKITTVKGTNDYLPEEVRLRDYLQNQILNTYQDAGFERIMTPAVEDIENLDKSDGGDNLNLIFKILKRGDKLKKAMDSGDTNKLCDMGLRYDLHFRFQDIMQIIVNNLFFLQSVYRLIRCTERKDRKRADFVSLCSVILI